MWWHRLLVIYRQSRYRKHFKIQSLDGHFKGLYRKVEAHFGGRNLYMQTLKNNCRYKAALIAENDLSLFSGSMPRLELFCV